MQRFKKEFHSIRQGEPVVCHFRNCPCNREKGGKFVYGANGTLTQAARWRAKAMWILCGDDEQNIRSAAFGFAAEDHLWAAKQLLQSAREGGCYLP
jgi:hypothetical protein